LYTSPNINKLINQVGQDGWGMQYACERQEMHTNFWLGNLKGRDCSKDLGIDERIILGS
jgi:hypothetical protein